MTGLFQRRYDFIDKAGSKSQKETTFSAAKKKKKLRPTPKKKEY